MAKIYNFPVTVNDDVDNQFPELTINDIPEIDDIDYYAMYNKTSCDKCGKSLDYNGTQKIWGIRQSGSYDDDAEICDECMQKFVDMVV